MAKMFYTTEEAAAKLNVTPDALKQYVSDNKLREFRDGARVMFKVDQVDKLAEVKPTGNADSGINLELTDAGPSDAISLADSGIHRALPRKTPLSPAAANPRAAAFPWPAPVPRAFRWPVQRLPDCRAKRYLSPAK